MRARWQMLWGDRRYFVGPVCGAESLAADRMIGQARLAHILGAIDIAKIDENIAAHGVKIMRRCQGPEFVPFGDDNRHIRALEAGSGAVGENGGAWQHGACFFHRLRVIDPHHRTGLNQGRQNI